MKNDMIGVQARKSRTAMRTRIFESVYQILLNKDAEIILDDGFEQDTFRGIVQNMTELKSTVDSVAIGFRDNRLYKVDLSILLVATYELLYCLQTPHEVIIDQAVELAKIYSTEKSPKFVNGVLAQILVSSNRPK